MSSISNFNSSSTNLYQLFSSLANSSAGATADSTNGATSTSSNSQAELVALLAIQQSGATQTSTTDPSTTNSNSTTGAANATSGSGASSISLASLRQQIETAVNNAVANLSSSQLANPGATAQVVKQAVDQTLQQNGIDPTQTQPSTPPEFGGGVKKAQASSGAGGSSSSASSSSTTNSAAAGTSSTTGSLLDDLLSANNVDPSDFQNSLLSALSSSQNGGVDFSQLFQNFPSGQDIDAVA